MEELKWGDSAHPWVRPGTLMTNGPGVYLDAIVELAVCVFAVFRL